MQKKGKHFVQGYLLQTTKPNSNYLSVGHVRSPFQDKVNKREENRNNFIYRGGTWQVTKVKVYLVNFTDTCSIAVEWWKCHYVPMITIPNTYHSSLVMRKYQIGSKIIAICKIRKSSHCHKPRAIWGDGKTNCNVAPRMTPELGKKTDKFWVSEKLWILRKKCS